MAKFNGNLAKIRSKKLKVRNCAAAEKLQNLCRGRARVAGARSGAVFTVGGAKNELVFESDSGDGCRGRKNGNSLPRQTRTRIFFFVFFLTAGRARGRLREELGQDLGKQNAAAAIRDKLKTNKTQIENKETDYKET